VKLFPSRCYNGGQQHRFEARHTDVPGTTPLDEDTLIQTMFFVTERRKSEVVRALRGDHSRYHGDVCVWCGKVVNQPGVKA